MVEKPDTVNGIQAALCIQLGRQIAPNDMVFGVLAGDEDTGELDDLII